MELLTKIKRYIMFFIISLPLVLVSYEAFMAMAVGTKSWAYLFIGQLLIVPIAAIIIALIFDLLYAFPLIGGGTPPGRLLILIIFLSIAMLPIIILSSYYGTIGNAFT